MPSIAIHQLISMQTRTQRLAGSWAGWRASIELADQWHQKMWNFSHTHTNSSIQFIGVLMVYGFWADVYMYMYMYMVCMGDSEP